MIFDRTKIKNLLNEFNDLYQNRPIINNEFGMKSPQLFGLFCYLKLYNPKLIVESGIYKGLGTWLIRNTIPNCELICIEPNLHLIEYKDSFAKYYNTDLLSLDLSQIFSKYESEEILIFFDDHQDFHNRINFLIGNKIYNILFEDNYPSGIGDCISPKKIMIDSDKLFFKEFIESYEEFPPIYKPTLTGWGDSVNNYDYLDALLEVPSDNSIFWEEKNHYYWLCYIKLKKK